MIILRDTEKSFDKTQQKTKDFSLRLGKIQGCLLSPFLFNITLEVLFRVIWQKNKIKNFLILKIAIISEFIYSLSMIPTKTPPTFFAELVNLILKFTGKSKEPRVVKTFLKKNKGIEFTLPDFKTYYKSTTTKTL